MFANFTNCHTYKIMVALIGLIGKETNDSEIKVDYKTPDWFNSHDH
jgi:hypothetical protein